MGTNKHEILQTTAKTREKHIFFQSIKNLTIFKEKLLSLLKS